MFREPTLSWMLVLLPSDFARTGVLFGLCAIAAVLPGLIVCLFRELALPYLAVMSAFALAERRAREAVGWIAAGLVFLALFAWHLDGRLYGAGGRPDSLQQDTHPQSPGEAAPPLDRSHDFTDRP